MKFDKTMGQNLYETGVYGYGIYLGHINDDTAVFYDRDGGRIVISDYYNPTPTRKLEADEAYEAANYIWDVEQFDDEFKTKVDNFYFELAETVA